MERKGGGGGLKGKGFEGRRGRGSSKVEAGVIFFSFFFFFFIFFWGARGRTKMRKVRWMKRKTSKMGASQML